MEITPCPLLSIPGELMLSGCLVPFRHLGNSYPPEAYVDVQLAISPTPVDPSPSGGSLFPQVEPSPAKSAPPWGLGWGSACLPWSDPVSHPFRVPEPPLLKSYVWGPFSFRIPFT